MAMIDRICSWCKRVYGQKGGGETRPTHGACDGCAAKFNAEIDAYFAAKPPTPTVVEEVLHGRG